MIKRKSRYDGNEQERGFASPRTNLRSSRPLPTRVVRGSIITIVKWCTRVLLKVLRAIEARAVAVSVVDSLCVSMWHISLRLYATIANHRPPWAHVAVSSSAVHVLPGLFRARGTGPAVGPPRNCDMQIGSCCS